MNTNPPTSPQLSRSAQPCPDDPRSRLQSPGKYVSLIVRMWGKSTEKPDTPEDRWHIELEHIQSGGHWEFSTTDDLESFLHDFMRQVKE